MLKPLSKLCCIQANKYELIARDSLHILFSRFSTTASLLQLNGTGLLLLLRRGYFNYLSAKSATVHLFLILF
jgi:hypothetical protein